MSTLTIRAALGMALATMMGSEAFLAAEQHDYQSMVQCALEAARIDYHQLPRMAWCGLYSFIHRSL